MSNTVVSDIIVPEIFLQYLMEATVTLSQLFRSGILGVSSQFNTLIAGGGKTFNLPFWQNLSGNSEPVQSGTSLTVNNISTAKEIAVRLIRAKAWGSEDIAAELAGDDPIGAILAKVIPFWEEDMQTTLINTLAGIFADNVAADSSDLINDVAIEDGDNATDSELIGSDAVIDTIKLLGDHARKITAIVMHSTPYYRLVKLNLIDTTPTNLQNIGWGTYLGKTVLVDDNMPTESGGVSGTKFTTFLFARGSVGFGEAPNKTPVETDREALDSVEILINRRNFFMLPRGFAFISGSFANETPTNSELALAANWNRVYDIKNTGIVKLITNG